MRPEPWSMEGSGNCRSPTAPAGSGSPTSPTSAARSSDHPRRDRPAPRCRWLMHQPLACTRGVMITTVTLRFAALTIGSADPAALADFWGKALGRPVCPGAVAGTRRSRSEEHTSELQSRPHLVCRLLLEKKKTNQITILLIKKKKKKKTKQKTKK